MKLLGFVGSPRTEGTTHYIVDTILAGAQANGATGKLYQLNDLNFKGCQGCRKCKETGVCDLEDDVSPIYKEIIEADVIVVGSPVYMAYVTGQTKLFLDRFYAFSGPDQVSRLPQGKRCILVLTQGYSDVNAYQTLIKSVSSLISRFGFAVETLVVGGVNNPTDPLAQDAGARAYKLGQELLTEVKK